MLRQRFRGSSELKSQGDFSFFEERVFKLNCDGRNELGAALDAVESKLLF